MGLLDDAIREHLELKRRRGGDPEEIERAEREALGPVRRQHEPVEEAGELDDEHGPLGEEHLIYDDEEEEWHEPALEEPLPSAGTPSAHDELDAPEREAEWDTEEPFSDEPDRAATLPVLPAQGSAHGLEEETSEYDVTAEEDSEEDDVLEETPDFLQDTPDHDRLWFEQRPPRDFDFDG